MLNYFSKETPVGWITVYSNGEAITGIHLKRQEGGRETPEIRRVFSQLDEYFTGMRKCFDFPIEFAGTDFQIKVWKELIKIPYGEVISYKELAERVESPKAFRAVGNANSKNPIVIVGACHRVIAADGNIGGYSGGLEIKRKLLELEGIKI